MSIVLPVVSFAGIVPVGTVGHVDWHTPGIQASATQYHEVGNGSLQLYNESGVGLTIQLDQSGDQTFIPAGGWRTITLGQYDVSFTYTVLYTISPQAVSSLIVVYYGPGEQVDDPGMLGNSPIGLSGSVPTAITQVIQDGQSAGLTIVESTPTLFPQTILLDTSPKLTLNAGAVASDKTLMEFKSTGPTADWLLIYRSSSGNLAFVDATSGVGALALSPGNGIRNVGGQATVGSFGTPLIVAQTAAGGVHIVATGLTTILTLVAPATGRYRLSASFELGHAGANTITYQFGYTAPNAGAGQGDTFARAGTPIAALSLAGNAAYECNTVEIPVLTGSTITISYNNATAGPTDFVYASIERLQ